MIDRRLDDIWKTVQAVLREQRYQTRLALLEDLSFYVFRTDTNSVLARGIQGFEAAKSKANDLRKQNGLKWDQVGFKKEPKPTGTNSVSGAPNSRSGSTPVRYDRSSR